MARSSAQQRHQQQAPEQSLDVGGQSAQLSTDQSQQPAGQQSGQVGGFNSQANSMGNSWARQNLPAGGGGGGDGGTEDTGGYSRNAPADKSAAAPGDGAPADGAPPPSSPGGGGGGEGDSTGGPPNRQAAAADQAATPPEPVQGASVVELAANFTKATPTQRAVSWTGLSGQMDGLAKEEASEFNESVPEYHAILEGEEAANDATIIPGVATPSGIGEDGAAPAPAPELAPTPNLGSYSAPTPQLSLAPPAEDGSGNQANASEIAGAISEVPTSDPQISSSAGPEPTVPLAGQTDPERLSRQLQDSMSEAEIARAEAQAAILKSPGAERVQPMVMDEPTALDGLNDPTIAEVGAVPELEEYIDLGLPADVTGSFDALYGPDMEANLAEARGQIDAAADTRDLEQTAQLAKADTDSRALVEQAQSDQESEVTEQRRLIDQERDRTVDAQRQAVADVDAEVRAEHASVSADVRDKIDSEQARIHTEFANAEREAQGEITRGEREAREEKEKAERESKDKSWWEKACDFVSDCIDSLVDAISSIFDAIREAVSAILDAVKDLASSIIDAVCDFICEAIAAFGEILKFAIQGLLGEIFPELADALCEFVDSAVTYAQEKVHQLAEGLKAGIAALCDALEGALNAILNVFESAIMGALALAEAVLTGDWTQLLIKVLEAALRLVGISPDEFYAFVGKAEDTIDIIVQNPGAFLGNCIDAVSTGFGMFSDHFLTHLQNGFVGWLTGQVGSAGLVMPRELDLAGVFSIVAQVLGLTRENLRMKVQEHFGEGAATAFDMTWGYISTLVNGGFDGLWAEIQGNVTGLWDMVMGQIQNFLMEKIVVAAVTKIATMWNPAGAIVQAVLTAWNLYVWVKNQAQRVWGIVQAVVGGMSDIAVGNISGAAGMVETALANLVPVAIDLLASLIGLTGIGNKVREIIGSVQAKVFEAIDWLIEKAKKLFAGDDRAQGGQTDGATPPNPNGKAGDGEVGERVGFTDGHEGHNLWLVAHGNTVDVMVASTPGPVATKLDQWAGRVDQLEADKRPGAQTLLTSARTLLGTTQTSGNQAAAALTTTTTAPPAATTTTASTGTGAFQQADDAAEQAEHSLADVLKQLFTMFGEADGSEVLVKLEGKLVSADKGKVAEALIADGITAAEVDSTSVDQLEKRGRERWKTTAGSPDPFVRQVGVAVGDSVATRKLGEVDGEHQAGALAVKAQFFIDTATEYIGGGNKGNLFRSMQKAATPHKGKGEVVTFTAPELHRVEGADSLYKYSLDANWKTAFCTANGLDVTQLKPNDPEANAVSAAVFAGWLDTVNGAGTSVPQSLVGNTLRKHVWWTPDERAKVTKSSSRGIEGDDKFFELCQVSALAPEWYVAGFISFHVPIAGREFRRPTVWDGMMSPLWVQQSPDDLAMTGGGAPEVINSDSVDTASCRIHAHVVTQNLADALKRARDGDPNNSWTEDQRKAHTGPTPEDQRVGQEQKRVGTDTDNNRATAQQNSQDWNNNNPNHQNIPANYGPQGTLPATGAGTGPGSAGTGTVTPAPTSGGTGSHPTTSAPTATPTTSAATPTTTAPATNAATPATTTAAPTGASRYAAGPAPVGWQANEVGTVPAERVNPDDRGHVYHQLRNGDVIATSTPNKVDQHTTGQVNAILGPTKAKESKHNLDLEKQKDAFEARLGNLAYGHPKAVGAAQAMCAKAMATMRARVDLAAEFGELDHSMNKLLMMCGTEVNEKWAGRVGNDESSIGAIAEVMNGGGSLREMCTHVGNFSEQVLGTDILNGSKAYVEKLISQAELNAQALMARRDEVHQSSGLEVGIDGRPVGEGSINLESSAPAKPAIKGDELSAGTNGDVNMQNKGKTRIKRGKGADDPDAWSDRKKSEAGIVLTEREMAANNNPRGAEYLPFVEGARAWIIREGEDWVRTARNLSMPLKGGISGTTGRLMNTASQLAISNPMADVRLAAIGYLIPINAHSFHEIGTAARSYVPYTDGDYHHIAPLSGGELASIGPIPELMPAESTSATPGASPAHP